MTTNNDHSNADSGDSVHEAVAGFFGETLANQVARNTDVEAAAGSLEQLVASIDAARVLTDGTAASQGNGRRTAGAEAGAIARYIAFDLGGTRYAVAMENVLEVERLPAVTPIPNVPDWIDGLSNLRGEIISVVDLRRFFDMAENESDRTRRMLVVQSHEADVTTSIVVDRVAGIRNLPLKAVQAPTSAVASAGSEFITGTAETGDELLVILDLEALLQCDRMQQFNAMAV